MKKCPKCNIKYTDDKMFCRNCGKELVNIKPKLLKNKTKRKIIIYYVIIFSAIALVYNFANTKESPKKTDYPSQSLDYNTPTTSDLEIVNWNSRISGGYTYIEGSVENVGDSTITYYKIVVDLLNKYTRKVENSEYTISLEDLEPDESRKFSIMVDDLYLDDQIQILVDKVE